MNEHGQLLDQAREFCDSATGEVVRRIPDPLMTQLRAAKLVRGIPGKPSIQTESNATWFVFLDDQIRERVLAEWRAANRSRKRRRRAPPDANGRPPNNDTTAEQRPTVSRGLKHFRQRKNSSK